MNALTRKTIAKATLDRLEAFGSYDCDLSVAALAIADEMGSPTPGPYDLEDIVGRIADLVVLRMEAACN